MRAPQAWNHRHPVAWPKGLCRWAQGDRFLNRDSPGLPGEPSPITLSLRTRKLFLLEVQRQEVALEVTSMRGTGFGEARAGEAGEGPQPPGRPRG